MAVRVGINGFGRIGRMVFRNMARDPFFDVVAVNDITTPDMLAYLLKYDTVHGRYKGTVSHTADALVVDGKNVKVLKEKDPSTLPWKSLGVDVAVESTGIFSSKDECLRHVTAGAKKVLLTVPAKDEVDATIVMGVNHETLKPDARVISNASCTTNCLAPLAKVLHDRFGIDYGLMTTIHAYTNDQKILDVAHKDPRRARAAALNIIPTTTGAAKAVGLVIPELKGRLHGLAMRVPVMDGSVTDLVALLKQDVTKERVNAALKEEAEGNLRGILEYTEDPIVSGDVIGNPASSVVDGQSTMVMQNRMVKVVSWYDNEFGYSSRCVDLIKYMFRK